MTYNRLNNTPQPKEKKAKKMPKNFKIDNMTFDGNSDINWEDFVHINNGDEDDQQQEETGQQQQQQDNNRNNNQQEEDASFQQE